MFVLQGRRGSEGRQGLAGTPGAAVSIERKKSKPMEHLHTVLKVLIVVLNGT